MLLEDKSSSLSIMDIAKRTGIMAPDIVYVLENYEILRTHNGRYFMYTEAEYLKKIMEKYGRKFRAVSKDKIRWVPQIPIVAPKTT